MDEIAIYLRAHTNVTNEEIEKVQSLAVTRTLRRNEFLLREGEVCRHKIFVSKGLLRTFGTAADGSEHILYFAPEHNWTLDAESYDSHQPAKFNIAAVEQSEVLLWVKHDFDHLLATVPELRHFSERLVMRSGHMGRHRLLAALSATPEEKYQDFIQSYPDLLPRLPLHMIAAYLGVSLKTLTRIRHAQVRH